jgi:hypothetical protein
MEHGPLVMHIIQSNRILFHQTLSRKRTLLGPSGVCFAPLYERSVEVIEVEVLEVEFPRRVYTFDTNRDTSLSFH